MTLKMKQMAVLLILLLVLTSTVLANGLSVTLKRTNPGIAEIKPAELIFDVVNTNVDYQVQGFIICQSPDDVTISSSLGFGSGSGAQYVSPTFEMGKAPSQKAVYFTIDSSVPGDFNSNCVFKYIFFREQNGQKKYLKMNLMEVSSVKDSDYRELRLDKSVPFVKPLSKYVNAYCPTGKNICKSDEVIQISEMIPSRLFMYLTMPLVLILLALLAYLYRRSKI